MAAKKNSKPGAIKYFNDRKAEAYKSAARAMKEFKKNMPKAQYGESVEERLAIGKQKAAEEKAKAQRTEELRNSINQVELRQDPYAQLKEARRKAAEEGRAAVARAEATQPWAAVPNYAPPGERWSPQQMVATVNSYKKGGVAKKKSNIKSKKK